MADYFATKYESAADEVIALLALDVESSGDVESPTGWFALVLLDDSTDLDLINGPTDDEARRVAAEYGVTAADVIGAHIVSEDSQGFVSVTTYDTADEARQAFDQLSEQYGAWLGDEDE